jgi:predicted 3-demethylubiquinone-9 3-methyltransferase (glyoxalase superfamily)
MMTTTNIPKQKIIPCLAFAKDATKAATLYASLFPESSIDHVTVLNSTPSGDCDVVNFRL